MLLTVIKKELLEHLRSFRFIVITAVSTHKGRMLSSSGFKAIKTTGGLIRPLKISSAFWASRLDQLPKLKEASETLIDGL